MPLPKRLDVGLSPEAGLSALVAARLLTRGMGIQLLTRKSWPKLISGKAKT